MAIRVKNWDEFQHFKDRDPIWIKLYRKLLDDKAWADLEPVAAKFLVMLWLLAAEDKTHSGYLPEVSNIAFRLRCSEKTVESMLTKLDHWLIRDDIKPISSVNQGDDGAIALTRSLETYKEEKEKSAGKPAVVSKSRKTSLPNGFGDDWSPPMRAWLAEHCPEGAFVSHLEYFVGYAKANGKQYVDWEQAFQNAIKGNWAKVTPQSSSRLALYS